jgi:DNA-binding CsgD family transcriptional regulator
VSDVGCRRDAEEIRVNAGHSPAEGYEPARLYPAGLSGAYRDTLRRAGGPAGVQTVRGREAVARLFLETQGAAKREVLILDRLPCGLPSEQDRTLAQQELLRRGVLFRTIYDPAVLAAPDRIEAVRGLAASGEESRVLAGVPMKLVVADRRVGMVLHHPGEDETVLLHASPLLDGLVTLFKLLWAQATPLLAPGEEPGQGAEPALLSADDTQLLGLAAAGLTDHAVARRLGVAQRTVERRMRRIMDRLGARTRFQAGLAAARRGVLPIQLPGQGQPGGQAELRPAP